MTRVVVVADRGAMLAGLTAAVEMVSGAHIVRHASGRVPLDRLLAPLAPDLVLIGDLARPSRTVARLADARRAAPAAKVVVLSSEAEASRLVDALPAAVLPSRVEPQALAIVLREVIAAEGKRLLEALIAA